MHGIGSVRARRRIAAHPEHLHAEGFRETGQASADSAEPDNDQRLAREFVFALPEVGDHPAPVVPCLVIARFGTERTIACDVVAVNYGFAANSELGAFGLSSAW